MYLKELQREKKETSREVFCLLPSQQRACRGSNTCGISSCCFLRLFAGKLDRKCSNQDLNQHAYDFTHYATAPSPPRNTVLAPQVQGWEGLRVSGTRKKVRHTCHLCGRPPLTPGFWFRSQGNQMLQHLGS